MKTTKHTILQLAIIGMALLTPAGLASADTSSVVAAANALIATSVASGASPTVETNDTLTLNETWSNLPGANRNGPTIGGGPAALTTDLSSNIPSGQTISPRAAALALCAAALSSIGTNTMNEIRLADDVIRATATSQPWNFSNYHIAILGTPSTNSPWLLQISGHHLTYNIAYNAPYVSATPMFIGVEPPNYTMLANGTNSVVVGYVNNVLTYYVGTPTISNATTTATTTDPGIASGVAHAPLETQRAAVYSLATAIQDDSSVSNTAKLSGTFTDVAMGVDQAVMGNNDFYFPFLDETAEVYPTGTTGRGVLYSSLSATEKSYVTNVIAAWVNTQATNIASSLLADYENPVALNATYIGYAPGTGGAADFTSNINSAETSPSSSQHSYIRIDGPRCWIEFVVQEAVAFANEDFVHYHSIWRDKLADYGNEFGGYLDVSSNSTTYTRPAITIQPVSTNIPSGGTNLFFVTATGSATLFYQWYSNSVAIANATNATLAASNAASYTVVVMNQMGTVTSANATLSVSTPTAPVLAPVANSTINPGYSLVITNTATDTNSPAPTLTFGLPTAPTNAAINSTSGILTWRPFIAQANSTNPFAVIVTASGTPSLSATQAFTVFVNPIVLPTDSVAGYTQGTFRINISGMVGPDYTIQGSTNLTATNWVSLYKNTPSSLPFIYTNSTASNYPAQYFRVLLGP